MSIWRLLTSAFSQPTPPVAESQTNQDTHVSLAVGEPAEIEAFYSAIRERFITEVLNSKLIQPPQWETFIQKLDTISLSAVQFTVLFDGENILSADEKRSLGLNTRKKYTREFLNLIDLKQCQGQCPKTRLEMLWHKTFHEVAREDQLKKLKAADIQKIEILPCGDSNDCEPVAQLHSVFSWENLPVLPLPNCNATYCRCTYSAVFEDSDFGL